MQNGSVNFFEILNVEYGITPYLDTKRKTYLLKMINTQFPRHLNSSGYLSFRNVLKISESLKYFLANFKNVNKFLGIR